MLSKKISEKKTQTRTLLIIFIGLLLFGINNQLIKENYFASDFTPMYLRGRLLLEEKLSPYSSETKIEIEEYFIKQIDEDNSSWISEILPYQKDQSFYFLYGVPALVLMFIPILIPFEKTAFLLWLVINEIAIIITIISISALIPKKNRRMIFVFLLSSCFFLPIVFLALINGSLVILEMCFAWLTIYFIVNEKDEIAGIFLALLFGRLLLFLPYIIAIFLFLFSQRRFKILKSFFLTISLFLAISFIIDPKWVFKLFYTISIAVNVVGFGIGSKLSSFLGINSLVLIFFMISVGFGIYLIELILVRQRKMLSYIWFIVLQFSLLPLMGFPLSITDYYILYPATAIILIGWYAKFGKKLFSNLYLISAVVSLVLWIITLQNVPVIWLEFLLMIIIIGNLYWVRWWIIEFEKLPQTRKEKMKRFFKDKFKRKNKEENFNEIS